MRTCDAAVLVLRETGAPAVMWGDESLLHMIADRAGLKKRSQGWRTSRAVLANLSACPGDLCDQFTVQVGGRQVRIFYLPECAPSER